MSEPFDAYQTWLGIPPAEQPPNNYRLLGITPLEGNAELIAGACDEWSAYLKTLPVGEHAAERDKLLKRVAAARACLLDPAKKAVYDDALRAILAAAGQASTGGQPAGPVQLDQLGQGSVFGDYVLLAHLSDTKSGSMWRAKHRQQDRVVTLKLLPPEAARNPLALQRFEREARLCARLNHPHLVGGGAPDAAEVGGIHYLILEGAGGEDLAAVVARQGPLAAAQAVDYVRQAAEGLGYLHDNKIYHRNVKPANLVVDRQGTVKVANMLMARLDDAAEEAGEESGRLTQSGDMLGTADYLAPEQAFDAHAADQRADIYSLGCTLFTLLIGRPPYPEKSLLKKVMAHREQPIPSLRELRPDVPEEVDLTFQKMVAKEPEGRYQSMAEVVMALSGHAASPLMGISPGLQTAALSMPAPQSMPTTAAPAPQPEEGRPPVLLWAAIGLAALAAVIVIAVVVALVKWL